jgi:hypothetical protein
MGVFFSERLFMMLQVYADESSIAKKFVAVGGYIATADEWKNIGRRWRKVLSNYRAAPLSFQGI